MKRKLIRITTIPLSLFSLLKGQLKFMNNYFDVIGVSSEGEFLELVAKNEEVKILPVTMTRTISPIQDIKSAWALYRLFKREKPFIVHTHTPKAGTVGMLAAKIAGVPHRFHTVAGLPLLESVSYKRKLLDLVEKVTYACATKIYPNSNGLKNIIVKNKFAPIHKLKVIGEGSSNGIDTSYFDSKLFNEDHKKRIRHESKFSQDDFVFIFVGRLVTDKGINELLEAFNQISCGIKKVKLLLVGFLESELDPLTTVSLNILQTNVNISHVGFQSDVRPYFAIADALVFPSYREGFPNVVMQAGAMGLPSIVSNINGCNEIIIENKNGILVPTKNIKALYEAMVLFLDRKDFLITLKNHARPMIVDRFEQHVVWKAILAEYNSLEEKNVL